MGGELDWSGGGYCNNVSGWLVSVLWSIVCFFCCCFFIFFWVVYTPCLYLHGYCMSRLATKALPLWNWAAGQSSVWSSTARGHCIRLACLNMDSLVSYYTLIVPCSWWHFNMVLWTEVAWTMRRHSRILQETHCRSYDRTNMNVIVFVAHSCSDICES